MQIYIFFNNYTQNIREWR